MYFGIDLPVEILHSSMSARRVVRARIEVSILSNPHVVILYSSSRQEPYTLSYAILIVTFQLVRIFIGKE